MREKIKYVVRFFLALFDYDRSLHMSNNGRLLINLSLALLRLYLSSILALFAAPIKPLCILLSAVLNYFFLVTLLAMASEAFLGYLKLIVVFKQRGGRLTSKCAIVTWGKEVLSLTRGISYAFSTNFLCLCVYLLYLQCLCVYDFLFDIFAVTPALVVWFTLPPNPGCYISNNL